MRNTFQAHPWHGISLGDDAPARVTAYIEMVPSDTVKYELDKASGHLRLDRPHRYSSVCPTLYGFLPATLCDRLVGQRADERTGRNGIQGDADPMDVCVLTEKSIPKGGFLVDALPIGGLRMIDGDQADDKIIAVLVDDLVHGATRELVEAPSALIDRLRHYFLTYKQLPGESKRKVEIVESYGRDEALEMIRRSAADYQAKFPDGRPGE